MEGLSSLRQKMFNNLVAPDAMVSTSKKKVISIYFGW
jgi:hypothetical protein